MPTGLRRALHPQLAGPPSDAPAKAPALTVAYWLSALTAPLAALAAAAGLAVPGLYRDPAVLVPQARGQDLVTLVVGVPLLAGALLATRRGSARGHLLWLGALGYLAYAYTSYAFGARFNPLFLVYVALMGLAIYALALGLAGTDASALAARFSPRAPTRRVGGFLIAVSGLMAFVWLADIALVLPALAGAGILLLRRAPWGYVLAGVMLVKAATLGLAILAMGLFLYLAEQPLTPGLAGFFTALAFGASGLTAAYLRAIGPPAEPLAAVPQRRAAWPRLPKEGSMDTGGPLGDEMTAAQCLAALKALHGDDRCRRCSCLDWALAELQDAADEPVAGEAALLRVAPARLHPPSACATCPPLEAAVTWLITGCRITTQ
jgi:hypothetical protein